MIITTTKTPAQTETTFQMQNHLTSPIKSTLGEPQWTIMYKIYNTNLSTSLHNHNSSIKESQRTKKSAKYMSNYHFRYARNVQLKIH